MWFTETAWPPILISLAIALLFFAAWQRNRKTALLALAIAFVALCPAIYLFELIYVTEPEVVEGRIAELVAAVEADDADKAVSYFSEDNAEIRAALRSGMSSYRSYGPIRVRSMRVEYNKDGSAIIARFDVNGDFGMKSSRSSATKYPTRWELTWKKESGEWRIVKAQRVSWKNGKTIDPFSTEF